MSLFHFVQSHISFFLVVFYFVESSSEPSGAERGRCQGFRCSLSDEVEERKCLCVSCQCDVKEVRGPRRRKAPPLCSSSALLLLPSRPVSLCHWRPRPPGGGGGGSASQQKVFGASDQTRCWTGHAPWPPGRPLICLYPNQTDAGLRVKCFQRHRTT